MEKLAWFKHLLLAAFFLTVVLEVIAIATHQYTLSDFVLTNVRLKWRFVFCAWLLFHLVFEYPHYR